jgi:hypothetical protein
MIPVIDEYGEIVDEVRYNNDLDFWDGHNFTCGSTGRHKGLAKLGDNFVLIYGTQWQGERDTAELISHRRAVQEILKSGNTGLFDEYPELQTIRENLGQKDKAVVVIQILAAVKARWQGRAELKKMSLTKLITEAMDEYFKRENGQP